MDGLTQTEYGHLSNAPAWRKEVGRAVLCTPGRDHGHATARRGLPALTVVTEALLALSQDLKQAGEVVSPALGIVGASVERPGDAVDSGCIDDFLVPAQQDPSGRPQPPLAFSRRVVYGNGAIVETAGQVGQHRLQIQVVVGNVQRQDAVGLELAGVNLERLGR